MLFLAAVTDDWRLAFVWCGAKCELRFGPDAMELDHNIQIHRGFSLRFLMYMALLEMRLLVRIQQVLMASVEAVVRVGHELMNGLPLPVLLGQFLFERYITNGFWIDLSSSKPSLRFFRHDIIALLISNSQSG